MLSLEDWHRGCCDSANVERTALSLSLSPLFFSLSSPAETTSGVVQDDRIGKTARSPLAIACVHTRFKARYKAKDANFEQHCAVTCDHSSSPRFCRDCQPAVKPPFLTHSRRHCHPPFLLRDRYIVLKARLICHLQDSTRYSRQ